MTTTRASLGKMQNPVRGFLHGTAAVAAVVGTAILMLRAPTWPARISVLVFGLGMLALYTASSLYHSIPWREVWKQRMRRVDHSMIFVLIASSYTPIAIIVLDGAWRFGTLIVVWSVATVGIVHKIAMRTADRNAFSIALMVTLGWLAVPIMVPLAQRAGVLAVLLMALGGVLYTVGMVFLVTGWPRLWPRVFSSHELFHVLVVAASSIHYLVAFRYVVPLAR
ncbi:MAG: hemolysin III family protein [Acidimicrobiia bacterium]